MESVNAVRRYYRLEPQVAGYERMAIATSAASDFVFALNRGSRVGHRFPPFQLDWLPTVEKRKALLRKGDVASCHAHPVLGARAKAIFESIFRQKDIEFIPTLNRSWPCWILNCIRIESALNVKKSTVERLLPTSGIIGVENAIWGGISTPSPAIFLNEDAFGLGVLVDDLAKHKLSSVGLTGFDLVPV